MRTPKSVEKLDELGRVRLSQHFFMRDFLYSEIASLHGMPNIPEDPDLAIEAGTHLCQELLEPLHLTFGGIAIRSAYRSPTVNAFGNARNYNCARNEANYAGHIWDRRDEQGRMGATACIVVPWFADLYERGREWQALAWWVHDHLPYSSMEFFGKRAAFNLNWRERPDREIYGQVAPKGYLTRPGMVGHHDDHSASYGDFPVLRTT